MAFDNLRDFVQAIDAAGDLVRVARPVAVDREITEIADRCMKSPGGGPALLFERPRLLTGGDSRHPVAVNLFGSGRRMAMALGVERLDAIGDRIAELVHLKVPEGLLGKIAMLPKLAELAKFPPRTASGRAPCQPLAAPCSTWRWVWLCADSSSTLGKERSIANRRSRSAFRKVSRPSDSNSGM